MTEYIFSGISIAAVFLGLGTEGLLRAWFVEIGGAAVHIVILVFLAHYSGILLTEYLPIIIENAETFGSKAQWWVYNRQTRVIGVHIDHAGNRSHFSVKGSFFAGNLPPVIRAISLRDLVLGLISSATAAPQCVCLLLVGLCLVGSQFILKTGRCFVRVVKSEWEKLPPETFRQVRHGLQLLLEKWRVSQLIGFYVAFLANVLEGNFLLCVAYGSMVHVLWNVPGLCSTAVFFPLYCLALCLDRVLYAIVQTLYACRLAAPHLTPLALTRTCALLSNTVGPRPPRCALRMTKAVWAQCSSLHAPHVHDKLAPTNTRTSRPTAT